MQDRTESPIMIESIILIILMFANVSVNAVAAELIHYERRLLSNLYKHLHTFKLPSRYCFYIMLWAVAFHLLKKSRTPKAT